MVGHKHGLTVPRHQGVDGSEQNRSGHGRKDGKRIATSDIAKAIGHAAIEPVLESDETIHLIVLSGPTLFVVSLGLALPF
jgi:hypothetical protein